MVLRDKSQTITRNWAPVTTPASPSSLQIFRPAKVPLRLKLEMATVDSIRMSAMI